MKNKLMDLNNHLFEQLERLNDEDLNEAELEKEIKRTDSMVKISSQIIENANIFLHAAKLMAEYGGDYVKLLPAASAESHPKEASKIGKAK